MAVRAGANSIESFLSLIGNNLVILSNNPNQENLDQFIKLWSKSDVTGIIVTDRQGVVIRISNTLGIKDLGSDISSRDYFDWSKTAKRGEYRVFPPVVSKIGASKGNYIFPVAVPLLDSNGKFNGSLVVSILLSDLANVYINNLKVLDSSRVYLTTNKGEIIYSDIQELTGKNIQNMFITDFLGKDKVIEVILEDLQKPDETKLKLAMPNFENNKLEPYLISSAPINVSDQLWKLVVVTPEKDLLMFTYKTFRTQVLGIFIIVVIFIVLTLRISRNTGYQEAVIDEHKVHKITS